MQFDQISIRLHELYLYLEGTPDAEQIVLDRVAQFTSSILLFSGSRITLS